MAGSAQARIIFYETVNADDAEYSSPDHGYAEDHEGYGPRAGERAREGAASNCLAPNDCPLHDLDRSLRPPGRAGRAVTGYVLEQARMGHPLLWTERFIG
jgi:hypothetical protein